MSVLDDSTLLTLGQLAHSVGVRRTILKAAVGRGELPHSTVEDGKRLWRASAAKNWLASHAAELPTYAWCAPPHTTSPRTAVRQAEPTPSSGVATHPGGRYDLGPAEPVHVQHVPVPSRAASPPPPPGPATELDPERQLERTKREMLAFIGYHWFDDGVPIVTRDEFDTRVLPRLLRKGPLRVRVFRKLANGRWSESGQKTVDISDLLDPRRMLRHGGRYLVTVWPEGEDTDRWRFPFEVAGEGPPEEWSFGTDTTPTPLD